MLPLLAALLAPLALLLLGVNADHKVCSWTGPGPGDPTRYGWVKYCIALPQTILVPNGGGYDSKARYHCNDQWKGFQVADWNFLDKNGTLEYGTPCNGGGYGYTGCAYPWWAVCTSDKADFTSGKIDCLYLDKSDDCEWPTKYAESKDLPASVGIFYGPTYKRAVTVRKDH